MVKYKYKYTNTNTNSHTQIQIQIQVIEANGGFPPLTYAQFCHVSKAVGPPPGPETTWT